MSATSHDSGTWIPLMDYAMKNGVSLSTLRRYIKAGKVPYCTENGKYLILSNAVTSHQVQAWRASQAFDAETTANEEGTLEARIADLELQVKRTQEEISELKMLVAIYEERLFQNLPGQL